MTDSIFRRSLLLPLLLLTLAMPAAAAEQAIIYTIKKGDTLWGLSERFMNDPYYWPNMWANNPEVSNPHLIFPGQKVRILNGRLEILPAYPEAGQPVSEIPMEELPQAETAISVKGIGSGVGFIRTDDRPLGILVDSVDNRVLLTKRDQVFLKMQNPAEVTVGDTYGLYQAGKEVRHPVTREVLGTMMNNLGYLQVTGFTGQTVSARIGDVFREVERGAELFDYAPPNQEISLRRGTSEAQGVIVAGRENKTAHGLNDVVFIDLGQVNDVHPGNLLYISRPRQASDEIIAKAGEVELPDQVLGAGVVIDTSVRTAAMLIIKSVHAIYIGDEVQILSE